MSYFKLAEFFIDPQMREPQSRVPLHVCEKLLAHHLPILNPIRAELGAPLIVSQHSGYRSIEWEHDHSRSGDSQHTFQGLGACDLTCMPEKLEKLRFLLIDSDYARVCWYPNDLFLHCDFKYPKKPKRYFEDYGNGWEYKGGVR